MREIVKISYYNEVHIKVNCEPSTAMEIADKFTFMVPGAKFSPAYKNKVWDGKIRLFNPMTCLLYAGLRDELEEFCKSRNYDIEHENISGDAEFSVHEAEEFVRKLQPKHEPRDYQYDALDRKSTRLNSSHIPLSRMPSSA